MFGSLENKRKRREKRENQTLTKATRYLHKMKLCPKDFSVAFFLRVTKTVGVYIGHPLCETTIKPNILARIKDKRVIHQNEVSLH